jgi:hypothetical protein
MQVPAKANEGRFDPALNGVVAREATMIHLLVMTAPAPFGAASTLYLYRNGI